MKAPMITQELVDYVENQINHGFRDECMYISPDGWHLACGLCGMMYFSIGSKFKQGSMQQCDCDDSYGLKLEAKKTGIGDCVPWAGLCKNDPFPKCDLCESFFKKEADRD